MRGIYLTLIFGALASVALSGTILMLSDHPHHDTSAHGAGRGAPRPVAAAEPAPAAIAPAPAEARAPRHVVPPTAFDESASDLFASRSTPTRAGRPAPSRPAGAPASSTPRRPAATPTRTAPAPAPATTSPSVPWWFRQHLHHRRPYDRSPGGYWHH